MGGDNARLPTPRTRAFADSLEFGPFPFVGIEWLEFPGTQFPLAETPTGLRLVGHVRSDQADQRKQ